MLLPVHGCGLADNVGKQDTLEEKQNVQEFLDIRPMIFGIACLAEGKKVLWTLNPHLDQANSVPVTLIFTLNQFLDIVEEITSTD